MKSFHSMHLSGMSYWYNQTVGDSEDKVTECFSAVLETKYVQIYIKLVNYYISVIILSVR